MKTLTVDGRRYRIVKRGAYDTGLEIRGHGMCHWPLPEGVTFDSPELRALVEAAVARDIANRRSASEAVQTRVREGRAGLA